MGTALLGAALASGPTPALVFDSIPPFDELVASAPLAFRGEVIRIDYGHAKVPNRRSIPYTNITLRVVRAFTGTGPGWEVTLRQIGGPLEGQADRAMLIPGLADLSIGEEVYIFADDRKQPFFATLYGETSLFRVARDEGETERVLNSGWQQMELDGGELRAAPGRYCRPLAEDRRRCRRLVEDRRDVGDEDAGTERQRAVDLSTEAFEERIQALITGRREAAGPGQTMSRDRITFEAALSELGGRGAAPGATASDSQD